MHIRIITFMGDPARLDDGIAYTSTEARPEIDRMPGSLGMSMWVERESGRSAVATGWVDRAALDASEGVLSSGVRAQAGKHLGGDPATEVFEMAVLHQAQAPEPGHWTRTSRFDLPAEDIDRAVTYFQETALPVIRTYDGLTAAVMLVDRERGRALTAATFDSASALQASADRGAQLRTGLATAVPRNVLTDVSEMELVIAGLRPPGID